MKFLVLIVRGLGGFRGFLLNKLRIRYTLRSLNYYKSVVFSGRIWFIPLLSSLGVRKGVLHLGSLYQNTVDKGWFEYYGGQGVGEIRKINLLIIQMIQDNILKISMTCFLTLSALVLIY